MRGQKIVWIAKKKSGIFVALNSSASCSDPFEITCHLPAVAQICSIHLASSVMLL